MQLPESRVRMEAEALFGYGSSAASMRLLWRFKLLDVLLPQLAERFAKAKLPRCVLQMSVAADLMIQRGSSCHVWRSHVRLCLGRSYAGG